MSDDDQNFINEKKTITRPVMDNIVTVASDFKLLLNVYENKLRFEKVRVKYKTVWREVCEASKFYYH